MFSQLKSEIDDRFDAIESYFKASKGFQSGDLLTAKGLVFVQIYAVYEYTVVTAVQAAIDGIILHGHPIAKLKPSLKALFLDPEVKSLLDSDRKKEWNCRMKLFERAHCNDPIETLAGVLPTDLNHYRWSQLVMIFDVFGIKRLPVRRKSHLFRIDEVVEHRNAIAHGRETAEDIGRRYTNAELIHRIQQMKSVCNTFVSVLIKYCSTPSAHCR